MADQDCRLCLQPNTTALEDLFDKSSEAAVTVLDKIESSLNVTVRIIEVPDNFPSLIPFLGF